LQLNLNRKSNESDKPANGKNPCSPRRRLQVTPSNAEARDAERLEYANNRYCYWMLCPPDSATANPPSFANVRRSDFGRPCANVFIAFNSAGLMHHLLAEFAKSTLEMIQRRRQETIQHSAITELNHKRWFVRPSSALRLRLDLLHWLVCG